MDAPTIPPSQTGLDDPTIPPSEPPSEAATLPPSAPAASEEETIPPTAIPSEDATLPPRDASAAHKNRSGAKVRYFGDYELLEEIARGGMGMVYKARQTKLNRVVALKMILSGQLAGEEDVKRFHAEAEAAANLDHPGITPIYEIGEHDGQHYFSMAFIEGESLAAKVADGPLPPEEAAELTRKISEAMAYAHERGVIHRDLKPANVLLDRNGEPKVTDFGLAKRLESDSHLTSTGQILGTPSYMPPEQAASKTEKIGPLADVYSLGAILFCLLTGRPPFQASTPTDTLLEVLEQDPVSPRRLNSQVPRELETICLKCLEKEPSHRFASALELSEDLARWRDGRPIKARRAGVFTRLNKWVNRKPAVAALVGLGGFVAASILMMLAPTMASRIQLNNLYLMENNLYLMELAYDSSTFGSGIFFGGAIGAGVGCILSFVLATILGKPKSMVAKVLLAGHFVGGVIGPFATSHWRRALENVLGRSVVVLEYKLASQTGKSQFPSSLIDTVQKRIGGDGIVRAVSADRIEVLLAINDPEQIFLYDQMLQGRGRIELCIVAQRRFHGDLIREAEAAWPRKVIDEGRFVPTGRWRPVDKNHQLGDFLINKGKAHWPTTTAVLVEGEVPLRFKSDTGPSGDANHLVMEHDNGDQFVLMY